MYQRKTQDEFVLLADYGCGHGFEEETVELTRAEIQQRYREYRENAPQYHYKIVKRRVPKSKPQPKEAPK